MARQIRQFLSRGGEIAVGEGDEWRFSPDDMIEQTKSYAAQVPNNPANVRSFSGGRTTRMNPYGDAMQEVDPVSPLISKRPDQWGGHRKIPGVDASVDKINVGPGFGFGKKSPLNAIDPRKNGVQSDAPLDEGRFRGQVAKGRKGTNFGSGRRNAPPPDEA